MTSNTPKTMDEKTNTAFELFLTVLHSKFGGVWQWVTGALAGYLIALAAKHSITLPEGWQDAFEEVMSVLGAFLLTAGMQWYQNIKNTRLQKVLKSKGADVKPDGWIGPNTIKEAKEI